MKLRFNLGRGDNYKKWQITLESGKKIHIDPEIVEFTLKNVKLVNQRATAEKINSGANKTVCCWIECQDILIGNVDYPIDIDQSNELKYNPRVLPYWTDKEGNDLDGTEHEVLVTKSNKVFKPF